MFTIPNGAYLSLELPKMLKGAYSSGAEQLWYHPKLQDSGDSSSHTPKKAILPKVKMACERPKSQIISKFATRKGCEGKLTLLHAEKIVGKVSSE